MATDLRLQEFYMRHEVGLRKLRARLLCCPWCGGPLPKSKREELFTTPTREDFTLFSELMTNVNTLDDAVARLGEADWSLDHRKDPVAGSKLAYRRQLDWNRLSETAKLIVQEKSDGSLRWHAAGQPRLKLEDLPEIPWTRPK